jgi:TRAP transporter TAXI family solute receptor
MRMLKRFAGFAAAAAFSASFTVPAVSATNIPTLLCPWGCGPTESDQMLMNMQIKDGKKAVVLPQETPGYMYNIREMANERHWKKSIFATEDIIIQLAMQGGSPELKEFLPEKIPVKFKLLYGEAWWTQGKFFVTFDPNIKTPEDFKGKRVALGLRGQSDWGVFSRLVLEHGYGITPKNTDIRHLTPAALTQQLLDGTVDVAITAFGTEPSMTEFLISPPFRQLEAANRQLRFVGVSKEALDKVNKKFGTTFLHTTLKPGTLPKQTESLSLGMNRAYKAAHPDFPEDAAYNLVMSVAEYAPKLQAQHPLWKIMTKDLMLHGLSDENVHPGAKRAFVELGWWNDVKKFPPVTYPAVK